MAKLKKIILIIFIIPGILAAMDNGSRTIIIDGAQTQGIIHRFWQVSNFANRKERTFKQKEDLNRLLSQAPFSREVVVDYALGGHTPEGEEYYLGQGPDGALLTDFSGLLNRIRNVVESGFTPWIGLENVPALMSDPPNWSVYGNSEPARDNKLFHQYVRMAMEALVNEFGREEVASWKFIIATEPDLNPGHWTGTREEFFDLLDHTLAAVLEVLPEADISPGNILNPASKRKSKGDQDGKANSLLRSRDHWGLDIIDHMASGSINPDASHGSKLSFFSFSWYARIGTSMELFDTAVAKVRARLARYPMYRNTPIDVREFGILVDENRNRLYAGDASEWGASFYAAIARRVYDLKVRHVFEWDSATFGVLHPRGQVISILDKMAGGQSLKVEPGKTDSQAECNAIACRKNGRLLIMVYNHHTQRHSNSVETVHLEISDPFFKTSSHYQLREWTIDKDHATWIHAFLEDARDAGVVPLPDAGRFEGSPRRLLGERGIPLFMAGIEKYRKLSELSQTRETVLNPTSEGKFNLEITMPSHSVRFLELSPK